ncbi:MAG: hypothetical protein ACSHYF_16805 [Verrucomicrobiaceae bacterium]
MKQRSSLRSKVKSIALLPSILALSLAASCERKIERSSGNISHEELEDLREIQNKGDAIVKRLEEHFQDERYTFRLIYPSVNESQPLEFIQGLGMLWCDNVTDRETLSAIEAEIQNVLTVEEFEGLEFGRFVRSPSQGEQAGEQDITPNR